MSASSSATPSASYLADFDTGVDRPALAVVTGRAFGAHDTATRISDARASGIESGRVAALAAMEARLDEQRAEFARQLAAERQAWTAEQGKVLAERLATGLDALEAQIADAVARLLAPVLEAGLCRQAVTELRADLEVLLAKDAGISLSITGPEDLLQVLREDLAGRASNAT